MGNSKVVFGNETLIDLTGDTVNANNLLAGETAHNKSGEPVVGLVTVPSVLDDLTDVDITTPTDGQVLTYDANTQTWVNGNGGGGGGGFDYKDWLTAGGLNPMSYADLAAVLADEKAVRKLMTIHLAVDYLAGQTVVDASINTILTDNTCAKWINLRDYALDTLYDNALFATIMDASGKYFLGEWAKLSTSPETWGPKGNVPIMTSNTAPYGECVGNTMASGYDLYKAFDGDPSTFCRRASETSMSVAYKFVNPTKVKRAYYFNGSSNAVSVDIWCGNEHYSTGAVQVSESVSIPANTGAYIDCNPDGYYFYYRAYVHSTIAQNLDCKTLQFYGRELKVFVPVMTSNTAPYGVASASSEYSSTRQVYMVFDGNDASAWLANGSTNEWVQYDFGFPVCVKMVGFIPDNDSATAYNRIKDFIIKGSDDNSNFTNIYTGTAQNTSSAVSQIVNIDGDTPYRYCRFHVTNSYSTKIGLKMLQFYGLDYSEYDWDADNPRHYLYDHGVELETLERLTSANGWVAWSGATDTSDSVLLPDSIHIISNTAKIDGYGTSNPINLSAYDLFRFKCDANGSTNNNQTAVDFLVSSSKTNFGTTPAMISQNWFWGLPEGYIDISSVSQNAYLSTMTANLATRTGYVYEMWLE